jgi:hypothetical protein
MAVRFCGMLMGLPRVIVRLLGVFVACLVIARLMVFGCGVVGLRCVLVVLGCLAMCFVCHSGSLLQEIDP